MGESLHVFTEIPSRLEKFLCAEMQWLERGSMNAAHNECNGVNADIAIAQRWLSKCSANSVVCIPHVVAKMFFMNVEALGDARISRLDTLFKNSSDQ